MNQLRPIHPGEILREEVIEPLGLSANALAIALRLPTPRISEIVRERHGVAPDTALRLACCCGSSPEFWMDIQSAYDLKVAARTAADAIAAIEPRAA